MKLVWRILLGLVALLVVIGLGVFLFVDSLAAQAIERGGSYALGVPTELGSADIGMFSGEFGLQGLRVANPPGFERPDFLALESGRLEVTLGSLMSDRVTAPLLELQGIGLDLERNEKGTNYGLILENLERFESGEAPPPEEEEAGGKTFVIDRLVVRDIQAHVDLLPAGGQATELTLSIPEIVMEDLGSDGLTASQICALVVKTLLTAAIRAGAGVLPDDLLKDLRGRLQGLESVAFEIPGGVVEDVKGALEDAAKGIGGEAGKAVGEAGKKLDELFRKKD